MRDNLNLMKVIFIDHSGFLVELKDTVLIFDYYKGKLPKISQDKNIYIFASHRHSDHFNPEILSWSTEYPSIHYILSKDIKLSREYRTDSFLFVAKDQQYSGVFQDISIQTLSSTDEGVAFAVAVDGKSIYHAGDLNWWHWDGESKAYNRNMEVNFKRETDKLSGRHFDLAFLPLDPRLESSYALGFRYFLDKTDCVNVFPMHMWSGYDIVDRFIKEYPDAAAGNTQIWHISHPGQEFEVPPV